MSQCAICGNSLRGDLFASVTGEPCCSICKLKYIGGLPTSQQRIKEVRTALGLADGEYLRQDNGAEAARILGRRK
jgi:hypothetical protein